MVSTPQTEDGLIVQVRSREGREAWDQSVLTLHSRSLWNGPASRSEGRCFESFSHDGGLNHGLTSSPGTNIFENEVPPLAPPRRPKRINQWLSPSTRVLS